MNNESKQLGKARQALVNRVLSLLNAGAMPWDNGMQGISELPRNAITGKPYRGMNVLNLMMTCKHDPRWLTFNQAKDNGYSVKKGAKGVPIELYKTIDRRTGKEIDYDAILEEVKDMTFAEKQRFKQENLYSFPRSYYVFNASDVHGIEPYVPKDLTPTDISKRNERIENVIASSQAPISYDGNGRNYYSPTSDSIHLTERAAFKSDEFFYNTALHEMAHSTGHSARLNRQSGAFGSKAYAREELVAEISSVLAAAEFGLDHSDRVIENSAEYVRSWATLIREDPQVLIDATFAASRATDYLCDMERQAERTSQAQEKTQKENLQTNVKEWYSRQYPTDELASELNANTTFGTVRDGLKSGQDIYDVLGIADSVVRERVFKGLADVLDVPYNAVYEAWQNGGMTESKTPTYMQPYDRYKAVQEKHPDAVVVMRLGDFYEVMGEKAKTAADELELTLTGRSVGLPERVPMCGFPYHVMEQYTEKLLKTHDVAVIESDGKERYILSHARSTQTPLEVKTQKESAPEPQKHRKPLMVNFYAGPSSGKTTAALELTAALKKAGYNVEYVSEYAKELVLENRAAELSDQKRVTDEQYKRFDRIRSSADVIVTDSPILLGLVYGKGKIDDEYTKKIRSYYDSFDNFNLFVERPVGATFQTEGRVHDEAQSIKLDGEIKGMLDAQKVFYGNYRRDDIAKTVERITTTYNRLYGEKQGKTQKENTAASRPPFKSENIPAEMKNIPNWVAYQRLGMDEKGHYDKKLYDCNKTEKQENGALWWAKSNDPTTWTTFDKADAYRRRFKRDGVAFGLTKETGILCIDLDKSIDDNGKLSDYAQKFLAVADGTYAERSTSGHGIHIFCLGHAPDGYGVKGDKQDIEVFDSKRLLSMTGDIYGNASRTLKPVTPELMSLIKANLIKQQQSVPRKFDRSTLSVSDTELLERITRSHRSSEFNSLMRGELLAKRPDGTPDHSASEWRLCNILAFFSGGDAVQVERIIKSSGLYRPTKPDKYYAMTAKNACDKLTSMYDPDYGKRQSGAKTKASGNKGKPRGSGSGSGR